MCSFHPAGTPEQASSEEGVLQEERPEKSRGAGPTVGRGVEEERGGAQEEAGWSSGEQRGLGRC